MRHLFVATITTMFVAISLFTTTSCTQDAGLIKYQKMKQDSLAVLLEGITNPTFIDSLYTEMYIGLKTCTCKKYTSKKVCHLVINKANQLLAMDEDINNRLHYLEAKGIALSLLKDTKGAIEVIREQGEQYAAGSIDRMAMWALYQMNVNQNAYYTKRYIEQCIKAAETIILSTSNKEEKEKAAYNISVWLIWLGKDEQAKQFMQEYAQKENDEIMMEAAQDFPEYKRTVRFRDTFN